MKNYFTFRTVFIGYGLKTGQGFYPGPKFLTDYQFFIISSLQIIIFSPSSWNCQKFSNLLNWYPFFSKKFNTDGKKISSLEKAF